MKNIMAVLLNGVAQLEYDRDKPLTAYQQGYLDAMDAKMNSGIGIDGEFIRHPELNLRIQFVTANLVNAMKAGDEGMTSALCTWLATRLPDLKQVRITEQDDDMNIELVFDENYKGQTQVTLS